MQKLMGLVRRCVDDYHMIEAGDRIAVGVSGGKDSLALLVLLAGLREYFNKPYELEAITIDMGLGMDYSQVAALCEQWNVPYTVVKTEIAPIIFDHRKEKNPCSMCAKMRRGALNQAILDKGFNKLALGHHREDAEETLLMSVLYEARLHTFHPVTHMEDSGVTVIRPMVYAPEREIIHLAKKYAVPVVKNPCPADGHTTRQEMKDMLEELSRRYLALKDEVKEAEQIRKGVYAILREENRNAQPTHKQDFDR